MIRKANLKTISNTLRTKMQNAGVAMGNQETLNFTAEAFGFKNWGHYEKVKEQQAKQVEAVFSKLLYIARLNKSVDRTFIDQAARMVEELKADPTPVVDNSEELKELRVALQWVCANYLSTLSGKPVRDADECLSHAKILLARAEPEEDSQPVRITSNVAKGPAKAKPVQNEVRLRSEQEGAANAAFETYNFGEGVVVVESEGWARDTFDGKDDWTKVVYVECDDDEPGADSHKVSFHAAFDEGTTTLQEAYAYWCETGADIGHPGETDEAAGAEVAQAVSKASVTKPESVEPVGKTAAEKLANFYGTPTSWGEHPNYPRKDWSYEVENGDTGASYWDYVVSEIESRNDVYPWEPELAMAKKVLEERGFEVRYCPNPVNARARGYCVFSAYHASPVWTAGETAESITLLAYNSLLKTIAESSLDVSVDSLKKMTFEKLIETFEEWDELN